MNLNELPDKTIEELRDEDSDIPDNFDEAEEEADEFVQGAALMSAVAANTNLFLDNQITFRELNRRVEEIETHADNNSIPLP